MLSILRLQALLGQFETKGLPSMLFHTSGWAQYSSLSSGGTRYCCSFTATVFPNSPEAVSFSRRVQFNLDHKICSFNQIRQLVIVVHPRESTKSGQQLKQDLCFQMFPNQMLQIVSLLDVEVQQEDSLFTCMQLCRKLVQCLADLEQPFHLRSCYGLDVL